MSEPSSKAHKSQERFFSALRDLFVGAKVEGESGFINLMRIKSRYYTDGVFPRLQKDIDTALKPFPGFRQELFDKLYDFFHRYFSRSGSIYFQSTAYDKSIYERIYTDDRDVVLFWKTHMLYYVKTDRLFRSMDVEVDDRKFYFDASKLEHKRANEKRVLVYDFTGKRDDGALVFTVSYTEKRRKTKPDEIMRQLRKLGVNVKADTVERAFRVFQRQSEVDYFINKNAKAFLREQFDLWLYQYVFAAEKNIWTEQRIRQLQVLKDIALKIIDFISQFEDQLVRIWDKPKFVLNSNYVITLDRIAAKDMALVERLLKHDGMKAQIEEWRDLGIVGDDFRKTQIIESELAGKVLAKKWQHLPIDTKYFKDLELEIIGLFDCLDDELDGWLIKSENYQALKTLERKWHERIDFVYIDPPFNTGRDFYYLDGFQDSTWLALMDNRTVAAASMMSNVSSLVVHLDFNAVHLGRTLLNQLGQGQFRNEIIWRFGKLASSRQKFLANHQTLLFYSIGDAAVFVPQSVALPAPERKLARTVKDGRLVNVKDANGNLVYVDKYSKLIDDVWEDIPTVVPASREYMDFDTQKPEKLVGRLLAALTQPGATVMDYFLGIGSSVAAAHKLRRKWLGIEMGVHFDTSYEADGVRKTGVLGRMKEVTAGRGKHEPCGVTDDAGWLGGGFFKYYELEQYEDCLRRVKYEDGELFYDPNADPYNQYIFLRDPKLLDAVKVDTKKNKVKVDLSRLYKGIDLPETLSNLLGKRIRRIKPDSVEFKDGTVVDLTKQDFEFFKLIKPLIWW